MLAYISLLPIAVLVGFVTLIVFKRELHTVSSAHALLVVFGERASLLKSVHCLTGSCTLVSGRGEVCNVLWFCFFLQISFFGGLILNEGVNWLLKHILREPRPCAGE